LAEVTSPVDSLASGQRLPSALRNLSNWAGFACSSVTFFFLSPFVFHHLGNSAYGIWVLIGSLTGYLGLFNLGVRGALTRNVARFHNGSQLPRSPRGHFRGTGNFHRRWNPRHPPLSPLGGLGRASVSHLAELPICRAGNRHPRRPEYRCLVDQWRLWGSLDRTAPVRLEQQSRAVVVKSSSQELAP